MTARVSFCEHKTTCLPCECFPLRILWRIYSEQLCNGGRDIDVVDFFQTAALEVGPAGVEYGFILGSRGL